jgi:hypothetical protein
MCPATEDTTGMEMEMERESDLEMEMESDLEMEMEMGERRWRVVAAENHEKG